MHIKNHVPLELVRQSENERKITSLLSWLGASNRPEKVVLLPPPSLPWVSPSLVLTLLQGCPGSWSVACEMHSNYLPPAGDREAAMAAMPLRAAWWPPAASLPQRREPISFGRLPWRPGKVRPGLVSPLQFLVEAIFW